MRGVFLGLFFLASLAQANHAPLVTGPEITSETKAKDLVRKQYCYKNLQQAMGFLRRMKPVFKPNYDVTGDLDLEGVAWPRYSKRTRKIYSTYLTHDEVDEAMYSIDDEIDLNWDDYDDEDFDHEGLGRKFTLIPCRKAKPKPKPMPKKIIADPVYDLEF